jgi:hypothetical protein
MLLFVTFLKSRETCNNLVLILLKPTVIAMEVIPLRTVDDVARCFCDLKVVYGFL